MPVEKFKDLSNLPEEKKAEYFDQMLNLFFRNGFGQVSKPQMELFLFSIYLDQLIETNKNPDNTIDYTKISDYKISQDLGITQQQVRTLKVKKQLTYPVAFDWKLSFKSIAKNAYYENANGTVVLPIPDKNLYYEIQNFIEEKGGYTDVQLNSKVLKMPAAYFVALAIEVEDNEKKKEKANQIIQKELEKHAIDYKDLTSNKQKIFALMQAGSKIISTLSASISVIQAVSGLAANFYRAPFLGAVQSSVNKKEWISSIPSLSDCLRDEKGDTSSGFLHLKDMWESEASKHHKNQASQEQPPFLGNISMRQKANGIPTCNRSVCRFCSMP